MNKRDYFVDSNTLNPADGYRKISGEKTPPPVMRVQEAPVLTTQ